MPLALLNYGLKKRHSVEKVLLKPTKLKSSYDEIKKLVPVMNSTLIFSRITGALFVIGFLLHYEGNYSKLVAKENNAVHLHS